MTNCTVVATFTPNPEHLTEVRELLLEVAKDVRLEPGCLYYDLYDEITGKEITGKEITSKEITGKLVFLEAWESRKLWQTHNDAPTVARIFAFMDGRLAEPVVVQEMYAAQ